MNSELAWTYMVAYLEGNFRDDVSCLIMADAAARSVGDVTHRKE